MSADERRQRLGFAVHRGYTLLKWWTNDVLAAQPAGATIRNHLEDVERSLELSFGG